jgi:hypothetical protein
MMYKQKTTAPAQDRNNSTAELAMKDCNKDPTIRQHRAANNL